MADDPGTMRWNGAKLVLTCGESLLVIRRDDIPTINCPDWMRGSVRRVEVSAIAAGSSSSGPRFRSTMQRGTRAVSTTAPAATAGAISRSTKASSEDRSTCGSSTDSARNQSG